MTGRRRDIAGTRDYTLRKESEWYAVWCDVDTSTFSWTLTFYDDFFLNVLQAWSSFRFTVQVGLAGAQPQKLRFSSASFLSTRLYTKAVQHRSTACSPTCQQIIRDSCSSILRRSVPHSSNIYVARVQSNHDFATDWSFHRRRRRCRRTWPLLRVRRTVSTVLSDRWLNDCDCLCYLDMPQPLPLNSFLLSFIWGNYF